MGHWHHRHCADLTTPRHRRLPFGHAPHLGLRRLAQPDRVEQRLGVVWVRRVRREQSQQFTQFHNYVALPRSEAFRIEYWALEEAKLQRMPAEAEFSLRGV